MADLWFSIMFSTTSTNDFIANFSLQGESILNICVTHKYVYIWLVRKNTRYSFWIIELVKNVIFNRFRFLHKTFDVWVLTCCIDFHRSHLRFGAFVNFRDLNNLLQCQWVSFVNRMRANFVLFDSKHQRFTQGAIDCVVVVVIYSQL